MSSRDYPVAGPDAGRLESPLALQGNNTHTPIVVMTAGTVDTIIKSGAPTTGHNTNPVWQFPADNRANATKLAA